MASPKHSVASPKAMRLSDGRGAVLHRSARLEFEQRPGGRRALAVKLPSIIFNVHPGKSKTKHLKTEEHSLALHDLDQSTLPQIESLKDVGYDMNLAFSPRVAIIDLPSHFELEEDTNSPASRRNKQFKLMNTVVLPHTFKLLQARKKELESLQERANNLVSLKRRNHKNNNRSFLHEAGKNRELEEKPEKEKSIAALIQGFLDLAETSMMVYSKWSNEAIKQDNQNFKGAVIRILQAFSLRRQVEMVTLIKLQKVLNSLEVLDETIQREVVTQVMLGPLLADVMKAATETMMYDLTVNFVLFVGKMQKYLCDFPNAARTFFKLRVIADLYMDTRVLQKAYFELGECYKALGDFKLAEEAFELYLHNCWFLRDRINELKAFVLIGFCHFYQNDLEKAKKFHQRSLSSDSALENPEFDGVIRTRIRDEESRKNRLLANKDPYYRIEVSRDLIGYEGDLEFFLKVKALHIYLSSKFAVDVQSTVHPAEEPLPPVSKKKAASSINKSQSSAALQVKREPHYIANFTAEGYANSIRNTNPVKYNLIKLGILKIEENLTKNVDLTDSSHHNQEDHRYLSHLSPNNSKQAFTLKNQEAEVCLQFFKKNSKEVLRARIKSMRDHLLSDMQFLIDTIQADKSESKKSGF